MGGEKFNHRQWDPAYGGQVSHPVVPSHHFFCQAPPGQWSRLLPLRVMGWGLPLKGQLNVRQWAPALELGDMVHDVGPSQGDGPQASWLSG